eukprot:15468021-Alexandrium_andersonii.AAC.1
MGLPGSLGPRASAGWMDPPTGLRTGGGRPTRQAAARSAASASPLPNTSCCGAPQSGFRST